MTPSEIERRIVRDAARRAQTLRIAFGDPERALTEACVVQANLCERIRDLEMQLAKQSIPEGIPDGF